MACCIVNCIVIRRFIVAGCVCESVLVCVCGQNVNIFVKKVELWIDNFCDRDRETQSVILYWNVCVCE